jgi:hypothetical protein
MRLLLDENLDRRLKRFFGEEHEVITIRERSWGGKEDGELIEAAQRELDALITMDQGIPHQQNLSDVDLAIVLLEAPSNRLADLAPSSRRWRPRYPRRVRVRYCTYKDCDGPSGGSISIPFVLVSIAVCLDPGSRQIRTSVRNHTLARICGTMWSQSRMQRGNGGEA